VEEKQATGITLLDLREVSVLADYFVICTVDSTRQATALLDAMQTTLKEQDHRPLRRPEGNPEAGWTLLDYGDVVVHIFDEPTRSFYRLEDLWKEALVVLKIQ
jgi:ribosome-associated protein